MSNGMMDMIGCDDRADTVLLGGAPWRVNLCIRASGELGHDVACYGIIKDKLVIALADGAGATQVPREAAYLFVSEAFRRVGRADGMPNLPAIVSEIDIDIGAKVPASQTTGIVALVGDGRIALSSCGDSEAWTLLGREFVELTRGQGRERAGSGAAEPLAVPPVALSAPIIVGSDGLWRQLWPEEAFAIARTHLDHPAQALAEAVLRKRGTYPDDFSAVVAWPV